MFSIATARVVLRCAVDRDSRTSQIFSVRPLVFLGRISYGLYLWHVIILVTPPASSAFPPSVRIALGFLAAVLSYRFVEQPFLRRKARVAERAVRDRATAPLPLPAAS